MDSGAPLLPGAAYLGEEVTSLKVTIKKLPDEVLAGYPYRQAVYDEAGAYIGIVAGVEPDSGKVWDVLGRVWYLFGNGVTVRTPGEKRNRPRWFGPKWLLPATHRLP